MATYTLNMIDSDKPASWMLADYVTDCRPLAQDSGRCAFRVVTSDPKALEAALDADDDVLEYEAQEV